MTAAEIIIDLEKENHALRVSWRGLLDDKDDDN